MSTITLLIIIGLLIIIAGISNAIMDTLQFRYNSSVFSALSKKWQNWFNPKLSWKNKWKNKDPKQGPAFLFSTTMLVFLTDAWHFFQMIVLTSLQIAIALLIAIILGKNIIVITIILVLIFKIIYGSVFELFFKYIFRKKL